MVVIQFAMLYVCAFVCDCVLLCALMCVCGLFVMYCILFSVFLLFMFMFVFRVVACAFGRVFVLRCRRVTFVLYRVLLHGLFPVLCVFVFVCARVRLMCVARL